MSKIAIIGGGFSGLSAACYLAKDGYEVDLYEKNSSLGGRARQWKKDGFTFDMGPTFYWMPDVLERFFNDFGRKPSDYYRLIRLDPGYEIYFGKGETICAPANLSEVYEIFEDKEPGSSRYLKKFIDTAAYNYRVAMDKVVYKPGNSPFELVTLQTIPRVNQFITSFSHTVRRHIRHPQLRQMLEFPLLFLGAKASDLPAFYCFMNYADLVLGTWHVQGGIYEIINGIRKMGEELGVTFHTDAPVEKIQVDQGKATGVRVKGEFYPADCVIASADYVHAETLIDPPERNYSKRYWERKVFAPSAILYYIAFDCPVKHVSHHTLFFDSDFDEHARQIYDSPEWPQKPLFYASFPTKTDFMMGPEGKEAAVILIPVASGLKESEGLRDTYFEQILERMESFTGQSLKEHVLFYRSYGPDNFRQDYHGYGGNAYGLANILTQTAFLKPKIKNRRVNNLFYAGQLTVPGPGIPPTVISGKIAAEEASRWFEEKNKLQ